MSTRFLNYEKIFDDRWSDWMDILDKLNRSGIERTDDMKTAYLRHVKLLCEIIREHPARYCDKRDTEAIADFKCAVYEMTSLFYNFGSRMMKLNQSASYYNKEMVQFEWLDPNIFTGDIGIPGCHSMIEYSRAITVHNIDVIMKLIDFNTDGILSYVEADGMVLPEYMHQASSNYARGIHGELEIVKYRLIRSIRENNKDLKLPYYYKVSDLYKDEKSYRERFYSEEQYQKFLNEQYPVICWMLEYGMKEDNKVFKW